MQNYTHNRTHVDMRWSTSDHGNMSPQTRCQKLHWADHFCRHQNTSRDRSNCRHHTSHTTGSADTCRSTSGQCTASLQCSNTHNSLLPPRIQRTIFQIHVSPFLDYFHGQHPTQQNSAYVNLARWIAPSTHKGMARLSRPGRLATYRDGLPVYSQFIDSSADNVLLQISTSCFLSSSTFLNSIW